MHTITLLGKYILIFWQSFYMIAFRFKYCITFLFYSPDMPENEATFAITAGGIADAKD